MFEHPLWKWFGRLAALGVGVFAIVYFVVLPELGQPGPARDFTGIDGDAKRGKYLISAAGCVACHTDFKRNGKYLAGGPSLKTPFGTFYAPNITSDKTHGIGAWSLAEFSRALVDGISPERTHYFPSFPYTSYKGLASQDIADLKAYIDTVPAVALDAKPHEMSWPFSDRRFVGSWKFLNFARSERSGGAQAAEQNVMERGAYLVNVLGHCSECHTQRDLIGGKTGAPLAGNTRGPEGSKVPSLRGLAHRATPWSGDDITMSLTAGMKPDGDFLGGSMTEVVEHSTSKLSEADIAAIATYLLTLGK